MDQTGRYILALLLGYFALLIELGISPKIRGILSFLSASSWPGVKVGGSQFAGSRRASAITWARCCTCFHVTTRNDSCRYNLVGNAVFGFGRQVMAVESFFEMVNDPFLAFLEKHQRSSRSSDELYGRYQPSKRLLKENNGDQAVKQAVEAQQ